jgi:hypothetical protein
MKYYTSGKRKGNSFLSFMGMIIILLLLSTGAVNENTSVNEVKDTKSETNETRASIPIRTSTRSQPEYQDIVSYDDVLVIRNLNSPMSMQIADYFQSERNIPQINICNITTSTSETVSRTVFDNEIRTPTAWILS